MSEVFAMVEGDFGKVVVIELFHDLVPHAHPEIQFGYWLAGAGSTGSVGDELVKYDANHVVAINRYNAHDLRIDDANMPTTMLMVYINETWFDEHCFNNENPISFVKAQLAKTSEIRMLSWKMMQKILFSSESSFLEVEADLIELLKATINANRHCCCPSRIQTRRKLIDYRLRLALKQMEDSMMQSGLIKDLPKIVGVSRSRLYEIFKRELKSSPMLIWNSFRIEAASKCMASSAASFSKIATCIGFTTAANFSRFFRGVKGVTPSSYKKEIEAKTYKPKKIQA